jgi:hypothetical protein
MVGNVRTFVRIFCAVLACFTLVLCGFCPGWARFYRAETTAWTGLLPRMLTFGGRLAPPAGPLVGGEPLGARPPNAQEDGAGFEADGGHGRFIRPCRRQVGAEVFGLGKGGLDGLFR